MVTTSQTFNTNIKHLKIFLNPIICAVILNYWNILNVKRPFTVRNMLLVLLSDFYQTFLDIYHSDLDLTMVVQKTEGLEEVLFVAFFVVVGEMCNWLGKDN